MKSSLILILAAIASATTFSISIYAPNTEIDGALLNAAGQAFYTGISGPATYCPTSVTCPQVQGTLVTPGLSAMAVEVPGGQQIYVSPDGQIKYTQAHSSYMPVGSFVGGWFKKTVISDCAPTTEVLDFLATDGSNVGGVMLCPDIPSFMEGTGASYQLYAKTYQFNLTNCVEAVGLFPQGGSIQYGAWQYI